MADFCNKCAEEMGFPEPDIDVYKIWESLEPGYYQSEICEGCGFLGILRSEDNQILVILDSGDGKVEYKKYDDNYKGLQIN